MALIACPECKKEVSEKALQCPHCGCPIATATRTQKPKSSVGCGKAIGVFLFFVFTAVAVMGIRSCVEESLDRAAEQSRNEEIKKQEDAIRERAIEKGLERILGDDIKNFNKDKEK